MSKINATLKDYNHIQTKEENIKTHLKVLYEWLAEITNPKCHSCNVPLACCDTHACDLAEQYARRHGYQLKETNHAKFKFMGPNGCTVPPHLRPICTMHVCDKHFMDKEFSYLYFSLWNRIDDLEYSLTKIQKRTLHDICNEYISKE